MQVTGTSERWARRCSIFFRYTSGPDCPFDLFTSVIIPWLCRGMITQCAVIGALSVKN